MSEIAAEAAEAKASSPASEASSRRRGGPQSRPETSSDTGQAKPAQPGQPLSLKGRALRLLTGREHSRLEIERKLAEYAQTPGELTAILDDLQAKGFISEARVIDSVVNRRAARFGAARIRHELQGKGLAPEAVAAAVQSLKGSELERAREVWRKRFDGPPQDAAERGKQIRFLAARGFGGDVIRRVVAGADED